MAVEFNTVPFKITLEYDDNEIALKIMPKANAKELIKPNGQYEAEVDLGVLISRAMEGASWEDEYGRVWYEPKLEESMKDLISFAYQQLDIMQDNYRTFPED